MNLETERVCTGENWTAAGFWLACLTSAAVAFLFSDQVSSTYLRAMILLAALALIELARSYPRVFIHLAARPPLWLSFLVFLGPFIASRLWLVVDYPFPQIAGDSGTYIGLAEQIRAGVLPRFGIRTPLYPLFLTLVYTISDTNRAVITAQVILSLVSGLVVVYCVHRVRASLAIWAALALTFFFGTAEGLAADVSLLTENLFTACLLLGFAFSLTGIAEKKPIALALSSVASACGVLARPSGQFLIVIYGLIVGFLLWNRYARRAWLAYALPLPLILLPYAAYDATIANAPGAISANSFFTNYNLGLYTSPYWEESAAYPPQVNAAIREMRGNYDRAFTETLRTSGDWKTLYDLGIKSAYKAQDFEKAVSPMASGWEMWNWAGIIARDAIRQHPELYLKHIYGSLGWWFQDAITIESDFFFGAESLAKSFHSFPEWVKPSLAKEYYNPPSFPTVIVRNEVGSKQIQLTKTPTYYLYHLYYKVRNPLFADRLWIYVHLAIFVLSVIKLVLSKGRHPGAFLLFILGLTNVGAALITSIPMLGIPRYAYPTLFVYYLSVALSPLLLGREKMAQPQAA